MSKILEDPFNPIQVSLDTDNFDFVFGMLDYQKNNLQSFYMATVVCANDW